MENQRTDNLHCRFPHLISIYTNQKEVNKFRLCKENVFISGFQKKMREDISDISEYIAEEVDGSKLCYALFSV